MKVIKKIHYQLANQLGIITWCWIFSLFLIGGIIILESHWNNYLAWLIIAIGGAIAFFQWQQHSLIIDNQHKIIIIQGFFNSQSHRFKFSQIKQVQFQGHQCSFNFDDKSYFPLRLWLSKNGLSQLKFLESGSDINEK